MILRLQPSSRIDYFVVMDFGRTFYVAEFIQSFSVRIISGLHRLVLFKVCLGGSGYKVGWFLLLSLHSVTTDVKITHKQLMMHRC